MIRGQLVKSLATVEVCRGKHGRTVIAQQDNSRPNIMLLRDFQHALVLEQWRPCTSKRAVRRDVNSLGFAEIDNLLLWQERVVFDLVRSRCDGRFREQLLHVLVGVVCDADGLDFVWVRLDELLHV
jgi:hypothetical protein